MATILLRVPVEAEPKTVYDSLSTTQGVNGWWSNHTEGPDGPGSTLKVAFPDAPITFDFDISWDIQTDPEGNTSTWMGCRGTPGDRSGSFVR